MTRPAHCLNGHSAVGDDDTGSVDHLRRSIDHASHLLPAQGPITVFVHHNTLHAFENLPFDEAVRRGGEVFGCEPYLREDRYRDALARGRIRFPDLRAVLGHDLGDRAGEIHPGLGTRLDLRLAMLQYPLPTGPAAEVRWFLAETDALRKVRPEASAVVRGELIGETRRWVMRDLRGRNGANPGWVRDLFTRFGVAGIETWDDSTWEAFTLEALWAVCRDGAARAPDRTPPARPLVRHRDLLLRVAGIDPDLWVNEVLVRFCAAFLDQGVSRWPLPDRDRGFLSSFCSLYRPGGGLTDAWVRGLAAELAAIQDADTPALESARRSLADLGVPPDEWDEYLSATLLALRGWGGMIREVEQRADRVAHPIPAGSLTGFVAVRLILDRLAAAHAAREAVGFDRPLAELRDELRSRLPAAVAAGVEERAFPVFLLAQVLGWSPDELHRLGDAGWAAVYAEVEAFSGVDRRQVFHRAYELRFRTQVLDAFALHRRGPPAAPPARPRFQVVTCIDDREESFRRHLEETAPDCETFGAAGFFAVPMYYRGRPTPTSSPCVRS